MAHKEVHGTPNMLHSDDEKRCPLSGSFEVTSVLVPVEMQSKSQACCVGNKSDLKRYNREIMLRQVHVASAPFLELTAAQRISSIRYPDTVPQDSYS